MKPHLTLSTAMLFVALTSLPAVEPQRSAAANLQDVRVESLTLDLGGGVTMKFVKIPAGKFMMGVPEDAPDRDKQDLAEREGAISEAFWIGMTEVTQAQYETIMGDNPSKSIRKPLCPVETVTPKQVDEFCKRLSEKTGKSARMPTEVDWEYAARAGSDGLGDSKLTDVAWCQSNSEAKPHSVGSKAPNA